MLRELGSEGRGKKRFSPTRGKRSRVTRTNPWRRIESACERPTKRSRIDQSLKEAKETSPQ
jgi:hypothetical protein